MPLVAREKAYIVGPIHIGKGLERVLALIDAYTGKAGAPPFQRYSTLISIIGGGLMIAYSFIRPVKYENDLILTSLGSYFTTKIWDAVEEHFATASPAAAVTVTAPKPMVTVERVKGTEGLVKK
ncbi:MAG: hypothetical protein QW521_02240 [Desulfurococcaceae archaeon]